MQPGPGTPMQITLYDPKTNEVKKSFSRSFVPWKLLKAAVRLSKQINMHELSEEDVDALSQLVCDAFGNQFSVEELNEGADISEMSAVLYIIIAKARGNTPVNPTTPGN